MWDSWYRRELSFSSVGFSLFSSPFSFRDPDQSCDRPPLKSLPGYFRNCPSALQIFSRIFLETLRPPLKSFQDILEKFLENNFPFSLRHESLIKLSQNNFHLPECFRGHKSSFTSFIRPTDSDCGVCLPGLVFEQLSQFLS